MSKLPSLFGGHTALVAGIPPTLRLATALRKAGRISLATAFAHRSGWNLIAPAMNRSRAAIRLITGLHFCQTEPWVLEAWLRLTLERARVQAFIANPSRSVFHSKVLIVEAGRRTFAIVGSGNLSAGGLRDNIECSLFTRDRAKLATLLAWFDGMCADSGCSSLLDQRAIDEYKPRFAKAQRLVRKLKGAERKLGRTLSHAATADLAQWHHAVRAARRYFHSAQFRQDWRDSWSPGAKRIRRVLAGPNFRFSRQGWIDFYSERAFGHLIPLNRDRAFRRVKRLQAGFRQLFNDSLPMLARLEAVLEPKGTFHVPNVGLNIISKVLAVHQPKRWPVYNGAVRKALNRFGYREPRGSSPGMKYIAFAHLMEHFRRDTEAETMLQLDPFFYRISVGDL